MECHHHKLDVDFFGNKLKSECLSGKKMRIYTNHIKSLHVVISTKNGFFCGNKEKTYSICPQRNCQGDILFKKSFIVRSEKIAYVFFIHSKDRVNNFNSLHEFRIPDVALLLQKILSVNEIYLRHQKSTHSAQHFFGSFQFASFW